jgi:hypothetical protein
VLGIANRIARALSDDCSPSAEVAGGGLPFQTSEIRQIHIMYSGRSRCIRKGGRRKRKEPMPIFLKRDPTRLHIINAHTSFPAPNPQIQAVAASGYNE